MVDKRGDGDAIEGGHAGERWIGKISGVEAARFGFGPAFEFSVFEGDGVDVGGRLGGTEGEGDFRIFVVPFEAGDDAGGKLGRGLVTAGFGVNETEDAQAVFVA